MYFSRCSGIVLFLMFQIAAMSPAQADEVILAYGDHVSGKLISFSRQAVTIETTASGIIRIEREYVSRITTDEPVVVDLDSGERIIGRITKGEAKTIVVSSSLFGERSLLLDNVDAISHPSDTRANLASVPTDALSEFTARGTGPSMRPEDQRAQRSRNPETIGQRPEDEEDIRKVFLREATVLLRPGQVEVEAGIGYMHTQSISPIMNARFRQFRVPLSARIGLFHGAEAYLSLPGSYAGRELVFADTAASHRELGIGDINAGFNYELMKETARCPDIIAFVGLGAPTGSKPNEDGLSLGSGRWETSFGVQFIKTVDPIALFWGFHYARQSRGQYSTDGDAQTVNPGKGAGYNFGFGFAANENISLSTQVIGSYQSASEAGAVELYGSSSEPVSLRSALTYRYSRGTYIEPSVVIGLNDDSADFILGISLTHRFGK